MFRLVVEIDFQYLHSVTAYLGQTFAREIEYSCLIDNKFYLSSRLSGGHVDDGKMSWTS